MSDPDRPRAFAGAVTMTAGLVTMLAAPVAPLFFIGLASAYGGAALLLRGILT